MTKSDIVGKGYTQIVTSPPKKIGLKFCFLFVFGQFGCRDLVSIPVVSFEALH